MIVDSYGLGLEDLRDDLSHTPEIIVDTHGRCFVRLFVLENFLNQRETL